MSPLSPLPPSPSLEQLKKRAKDLLRAYRAGDPRARLRVQAQLPGLARATPPGDPGPEFRLSDALLVLAREYGFPSWPKLKAQVEALAPDAETGAASGEGPSASGTKLSARQRLARELAAELAELARRRDVEGLAARFAGLPRRDVLAVRAVVAESGDHALLVDALIEGLRHANARVRFDCAHAMDHLADDRCVEPLRRRLDDPVPRVRRVALHTLNCDACKLVPLHRDDDLVAVLIERALADPSINVRREATYGLGSCCSDERAVAALRTLLAGEADRTIRRNAGWALRRQGVVPPTERGGGPGAAIAS